jgi:hypothetical protein
MANESLARIMYGTSEEVHVSTSVYPLSGLSSQPAAKTAGGSAAEVETLAELLHRVWLNVSGKN